MIKIRRCFVVGCALLSLLCCFCGNAASLTPPLKVVTESLPPYSFINPQGQVDGAVSKVVQQLLHRLDFDSKIEVLPWARAYNTALNEANVLIFSIARIPPREAYFHWLTPVTAIQVIVYARPGSDAAALTDVKQLAHKKIGVMRASSSVNFLRSYAQVSDDNLVMMSSFEQLYKMLLYQRADLALAPELLVSYLDKKYATPKEQRPVPVFRLPLQENGTLYLALSQKTSPALVQKFQAGVDEMQKSGEIERIINHYKQQFEQQEPAP